MCLCVGVGVFVCMCASEEKEDEEIEVVVHEEEREKLVRTEINKIIFAHATITVHICTVTVTLVFNILHFFLSP